MFSADFGHGRTAKKYARATRKNVIARLRLTDYFL